MQSEPLISRSSNRVWVQGIGPLQITHRNGALGKDPPRSFHD